MTVWVVMGHEFEDSWIESVWESEEKANAEQRYLTKRHKHIWFGIQKCEVQ